METTSRQARMMMGGLCILVGLFLLVAAPLIVQTSLERVLGALLEVSEAEPKYSSGIALFNLFYPLWRALGIVAGVTLLVIAYPLYKAESWTYPVGLSAMAIPSVSGMFMFLPYISWVGGFPLPMVISWIGLIGYWGLLMLRKSTWRDKGVNFLAFTLVGMVATHSFVLGIGSQRMLLTRPGQPLYQGVEWWVLTVVGEVVWIATVMLLVSIPLLAARRPAGWWLAVIASLSVLLVDVPTQVIRTKTFDYLYGALLAAALLITLMVPAFRRRLMGPPPEVGLEA